MHDKNKDTKSFTEVRKYLLHCYFFDSIVNIVGTPPPPFCREEVEPPTKFSERGEGLTGPQLLEGGCWERGGDFFSGVCNFHIKIN